MNCEEIRKRFGPYLDEELKPREAFSLETHLNSCFHCKADLGMFRRTIRLIGEMEPVIPPKGFDRGILRELGFEVVPVWRRAVSFAFVLLAGAWVALLIPWTLRSIQGAPELIKSALHLPARLTVFVGFTRTLLESIEMIFSTVSIVLRTIPPFYGYSMVFASLLLTLLFIKSLTTQLKEANDVQSSL